MGGSQSTRRVVVEDSNGEGVVKISEAVVKRIRGRPEGSSNPDSVKFEPRESTKAQLQEEKYNKAVKDEIEEFYNEKLNDLHQRACDYEVTRSLGKTLKTHFATLPRWKWVLASGGGEKNLALQQQTNEQFTTAVKEVEQKFLNYTLSPICQDLQQTVLQCYQANPSKTLNCSAIVSAFTTCVERARMSASIHRPQNMPQVETVS